MIVFTVAFGERYIKNFFERCLPSLFGAERRPDLGGEKLHLWIFTLTRDVDLVRKHMATEEVRFFKEAGSINVHHIEAAMAYDDRVESNIDPRETPPRVVSGRLLQQAIKTCIDRGETFLHAVPDLVYSAGNVEQCHLLHTLTGKTIAIFNGRVAPKAGHPDFTAEQLREATETSRAAVDFFFDYMDEEWRTLFTSDVRQIAGSISGHLVFEAHNLRLIFCPNPNPFLGRFEEVDLPLFADAASLKNWDHKWKDCLMANNRFLVQTNLDAGMSIEPESSGAADRTGKKEIAVFRDFEFQKAMRMIGNAAETSRKLKFYAPNSVCFTTSYAREKPIE